MLRIGEAAKKYDVSNRTLRYWEETGILKSTRTENGYRYYDDENTERIKQIVLFRNLRIPLTDVERIYTSSDFGVAIDVLNKHLVGLKRDAAVYGSLIAVVEKLLGLVREAKNLDVLFSCLPAQNAINDSKQKSLPQIKLSEGKDKMTLSNANEVRLVRLPAMTIAAYRAESDAPEQDCAAVMNTFVMENSIHKQSGFRHFGFNNPSPSEDTPVYGYEMWVSVPAEFNVPAPLEKKNFNGGLYASIPTSMSDISERWQQLNQWVNENDVYTVDNEKQCLEECIDFETFISGQEFTQQLDLLEPIKKRRV